MLTAALIAVLALAQSQGTPPPAGQEPAPAPAPFLVETITRPGKGVTLTADWTLPRASTGGPTVVCLHQEDSSRGEFTVSAQEFARHGCAVLAVDLRSGKESGGVPNATAAAFEKSAGKPATLQEAFDDVAEAVKWARELRPEAKVVLLGSGYSATLALAYAARNPDGADALIVFSPSECIEGWTVAAEMRAIKVPVHVSCGSGLEEKSKATRFFNGLDKKLRSSYFPAEELALPRGAASLAHPDESTRLRVWHGVHKIRLATSAPAEGAQAK